MRVLIVEDEPNLGRQLRATLEGAGYAVDLATDGEDGHYLGSTESYDAIILDLGLPEVDGLTVLDRWRKEGMKVPVLVLTARDSWSDKVAGLDAGADDYLAKPFQTEELIARLRALIRRASGNSSSELTAGDVRLDTRSGKVTLNGEPVKLTAQEYKLLSYLMHHKGKVVSRTELIEHIYDQDFDRDSNTIEVFVTRIRKKLGPDVISTIRGLGYSLEEPRPHRCHHQQFRRAARLCADRAHRLVRDRPRRRSHPQPPARRPALPRALFRPLLPDQRHAARRRPRPGCRQLPVPLAMGPPARGPTRPQGLRRSHL
jgi:two-component system OmpR family response regulator